MNITSELISKIYCKPEWYPYVMSIHCTCVNNAKCPYATTLTDNTQSTVLFDICSQYKKKTPQRNQTMADNKKTKTSMSVKPAIITNSHNVTYSLVSCD